MQRFVCHKLNIEYLQNAKVACTSIKAALLISDGFPTPDFGGSHGSGHWSLPTKSTFLFTFVRHPLERLVSCYFDKVRGNVDELKVPGFPHTPFPDFVRFVYNKRRRPNVHYAPQSSIFKGKVLDFVGRFERIHSDWAKLQTRFPGLADLPHMNASKRPRDWPGLYDQETLRMANEYYRADFERWPDYACQWEVSNHA